MADFTRISSYLLKFKKLQIPEKKIRLEIIKSVEIITGILLQEKNIDIRKSTVFIEAIPIIKNEIFYKKKEIIDFFNKKSKTKITAIK